MKLKPKCALETEGDWRLRVFRRGELWVIPLSRLLPRPVVSPQLLCLSSFLPLLSLGSPLHTWRSPLTSAEAPSPPHPESTQPPGTSFQRPRSAPSFAPSPSVAFHCLSGDKSFYLSFRSPYSKACGLASWWPWWNSWRSWHFDPLCGNRRRRACMTPGLQLPWEMGGSGPWARVPDGQ